MSDILANLFGDKSWYESLTAWGALVFSIGLAYAGLDLPGSETVSSVTNWLGPVLGGLGIRRAQVVWEDDE